ncbi:MULTISPECIES: hypothetical protein [unclassified Mesorhizobium]|uniref:hypothetical protein n=1 Tax=unclassified Mesorhizobium TaxID=325217 RepID=UPI001093C35F|nr:MULTISPECIES: hypothetical protein [unclassified Mesorhizobium]TGS46028.1 hypothetical protein EN825_10405 [Mesorhizobium sp. M8A.F.Ca.ET.182.01.1.1]TGS81484.1 hypothetical protein EN824_10625 [Mesorhizobium sp. M8A.F.Ca.ET.181.01.1.1]
MDDLQLTKKAEAYVATAAENFSAAPLLTLQIDRTSRKSLAGSIEALIDMLDDLSPDPDLEDGADLEPSLGWGERGPRCMMPLDHGRGSHHDDRELDETDYEDSGDAEPSLGWGQNQSVLHCDRHDEAEEENEHGGDVLDEPHDGRDDDEPWLGWGNTMGQPGVGTEGLEGVEDNPDYGVLGNFTGAGTDEARQMLRGRGRKEPSLTIVGPAIAIANWHGIKPTDPDQMDARAHYWAAKGF